MILEYGKQPPPFAISFYCITSSFSPSPNSLPLLSESLHKKHKEAVELSTTINTIKRRMDQLCHFLDEKRCGEEGRVVVRSEGGEEVLEEEDYQAITELKQVSGEGMVR